MGTMRGMATRMDRWPGGEVGGCGWPCVVHVGCVRGHLNVLEQERERPRQMRNVYNASSQSRQMKRCLSGPVEMPPPRDASDETQIQSHTSLVRSDQPTHFWLLSSSFTFIFHSSISAARLRPLRHQHE